MRVAVYVRVALWVPSAWCAAFVHKPHAMRASGRVSNVFPYTDLLNAVNFAGGGSPCDDHDHSPRMVAFIQSAGSVAHYI